MVINITDGEATDGDPSAPGDALKELGTEDGQLLLFNLHLSSHAGASIAYPSRERDLPDPFAGQLFRMSRLSCRHTLLMPPGARSTSSPSSARSGSG